MTTVFFTENMEQYVCENNVLRGGVLTAPVNYVHGKIFNGEPAQFELPDGSFFTTTHKVSKIMSH